MMFKDFLSELHYRFIDLRSFFQQVIAEGLSMFSLMLIRDFFLLQQNFHEVLAPALEEGLVFADKRLEELWLAFGAFVCGLGIL